MSFEDGWAAINLQMPKRVPRTEYSVLEHFGIIKAVTGLDVNENSPDDLKNRATQEFAGPDGWNFDFFWRTLISRNEFGNLGTSMGHAVYAAEGVDYDANIQCPFKEPEEVLRFDPWDSLGPRDHAELVRRFEDSYRQAVNRFPHGVNMTGIYITLISGFIDLFGWDMLLTAAGIDPEAFGKLADRYASWMQQYFDALGDADVPVVMVHDDIVWSEGAVFHPAWYRKYVFPNYKKYMEPLKESGKKIIFTSDGNYTEFIDDIAKTGVHGFVCEPLTDMKYIAEKYGKTHVFVGNADTRILLSGTKEEIRQEVQRCMTIGKDCPGFFMAVGNHIPSNTPVDNALYYNEVYEQMMTR